MSLSHGHSVLTVSQSGVCGASGKVTCSTTQHWAGLPPVFLIGKPREERREAQAISAQWRYDTHCTLAASGFMLINNQVEASMK